MNEADIQVLATIRRTEVEGESSDKTRITCLQPRLESYGDICTLWMYP